MARRKPNNHKIVKTSSRASRTGSKRARIYFAVPPASGWAGGRPEDNGYRRKASK